MAGAQRPRPVSVPIAIFRPGSEAREFPAFGQGAKGYGIDILKVQAIRGCEEPMHIADTPAFSEGMGKVRV